MGYRSDIVIAVCVPEDDAKRVASLYAMNPTVQKHNLLDQWHLMRGEVVGEPSIMFVFESDGVKWYDSYDDVQGIEYMIELVCMLGRAEENPLRGAYCSVRVGEESDDIEHEHEGVEDSDFSDAAHDLLCDTYYVRVQLEVDRPYHFTDIEEL